MEDKVLEDSKMKLYVRAIVLAERLNKALEVRLDVLLLMLTEQRMME